MTTNTVHTAAATLSDLALHGKHPALEEAALAVRAALADSSMTQPDTLREPTNAQIVAAARALNKRHARLCGVNEDDSWNIQSDDFKEDAFDALTAALAFAPAPAAQPEPATLADELLAVCAAADAGAGGWVKTARIREACSTAAPAAQPATAQAEPATDEPVYANWCRELVSALKRLSFAAQTTGGTAGPDAELQAAIAQAEQALSMSAASRAIDAAQPVQAPSVPQPLTDAQMRRLYENSPDGRGYLSVAAFSRIVRLAEDVHQIGAARPTQPTPANS